MTALEMRSFKSYELDPPSVPMPITLLSGCVLKVEADGSLAIDLGGRLVSARRAASCLLEPAAGDRVLVACSECEHYILAVLDRPGTAPASLSAHVPSDATILRGAEIVIRAGRAISLEAPAATVQVRRFQLFADAMGFVGGLLTQAVERWRTAASHVEVVSTEISTKAARRISLIEETDVLQAGAQVQTFATASVTSAQSVVVAAKEDLRLDGERVTVG
jgi:hypothetical protein